MMTDRARALCVCANDGAAAIWLFALRAPGLQDSLQGAWRLQAGCAEATLAECEVYPGSELRCMVLDNVANDDLSNLFGEHA